MKELSLFAAAVLFLVGLQACTSTSRPEEPPKISERVSVSGIDISGESGEDQCVFSISYSIGKIDPRFGITKPEVIRAVDSVIVLWSSASDQLVAKQVDEGGVAIQLVYDERQELVDGEREIQERLHTSDTVFGKLEQEYDELVEKFDERSEEYDQLSEGILEKIESLNDWIHHKNQTGGLTSTDMEQLESEKEEIRELQGLEMRERQELTRLVEEVNERSDELNEMVDKNNRLIELYNNEYAGEDWFTSGRFELEGNRGTITIFQFRNERELQLLLAHELGHAMGIKHLANPRSIMHERISNQMRTYELQLTEDDIAAVRSLCR